MDWTRLGLNVVLGAVCGGVTNWIAVWLIFRPYERTYGFHGAIPKNKARLAKTIGRTVGERLLTADDIVAELHRSGLREAIEAKLGEVALGALDRERGPLRELLPPAIVAELERALAGAGPSASDAYARYVATEEFQAAVKAFIARSGDDLAGASASTELALPDRKAGMASKAAGLASGLINDVLAKWIVRAARSDRARSLAAEAVTGGGSVLLDRPLGRLSRWLPDDTPRRLVAAAAPAIWDQLVERLPAILETVDIQAMVERKVLGFSTERVEEIVRGVTQRELNLIVQLGYVIGAMIGAAQFGVETMMRK
jgi:uncharacterized membrane protein YheB (UPF0754 family)